MYHKRAALYTSTAAVIILFSAATAFAANQSNAPSVDSTQKLQNKNWARYNENYESTRYSPIGNINVKNVRTLAPACSFQLGSIKAFEAGPVVKNGILYITTPYKTAAINATNCHPIWLDTYNPSGPQPFETNRGVAISGNSLYRGTTDGRLLDINVKDGKIVWNIKVANSKKGYFVSSAPIVWHGKVFVGTAGGDWGAPAMMFAFDAKTGKRLWHFDEIKPSTFGTAQAASTGGGSNWTTYSLDPRKGLLYVPVGNPAPDLSAQYRKGKDLYTDSVVVLNANTGKLVRYYQQVPNDSHDWDTAAAPVIFHSRRTRMMAVGDKAGYIFGYNDDTGKLLYKVPVTVIKNPNEAPTQSGEHTCPAELGGVEWNGPAYDPRYHSLVVNSVNWCATYTLGEIRYISGQFFLGGTWRQDPVKDANGFITSIDADSGKVIWQDRESSPMVAGVTTTAGGLVFTGTEKGTVLALDAKTGKTLYSYYLGDPISGGVITYMVNGKQYVAVAAGNAERTLWKREGASGIYIFALSR